MTFLNVQMILCALLLVPVFVLARRRRTTVGHSSVALHKGLTGVPLAGKLPVIFLALSWLVLTAAAMAPHLVNAITRPTMVGRDFVIVTDVSSSMTGQIQDPEQQKFALEQSQRSASAADGVTSDDGTADDGSPPAAQVQPVKRIDVAKEAVRQFIQRRKGDRVGLLVFGSEAYYQWPLTDDLEVAADFVRYINAFSGGTNFDGDGENESLGAIQAGINHLRHSGQASMRVLVLVSDGEASISAARSKAMRDELTELNIRLYVIGIGEQWTGSDSSTKDIRTFVSQTRDKAGAPTGNVLAVGDAKQLREGFETIDKLEKSQMQLEKFASMKPIHSFFILAGLLFTLVFLGLRALNGDEL